MKEIICPRCGRKAKFEESVSKQKDRKRIMLDFPCHHYTFLVYDVSVSTDINTIIKDFQTIADSYFDKTYYLSHFRERRLD